MCVCVYVYIHINLYLCICVICQRVSVNLAIIIILRWIQVYDYSTQMRHQTSAKLSCKSSNVHMSNVCKLSGDVINWKHIHLNIITEIKDIYRGHLDNIYISGFMNILNYLQTSSNSTNKSWNSEVQAMHWQLYPTYMYCNSEPTWSSYMSSCHEFVEYYSDFICTRNVLVRWLSSSPNRGL